MDLDVDITGDGPVTHDPESSRFYSISYSLPVQCCILTIRILFACHHCVAAFLSPATQRRNQAYATHTYTLSQAPL